MTSLLVSEIFPPRTGGSGRWFWEIYRRLPREDVVIAAGEHPRQDGFDQSHNLRVVRLPLSMPAWGLRSVQGLRGYWRAVRRLRRVVRAERIGAVHCGRCLPEGVMGLALKSLYRIPFICYIHGEDLNYASTSREHTWLVRRVLRGAEFVIVNSRNTGHIAAHEWKLPAERIRLLHPGVDTGRFAPAARNAVVRAQLGWANRPVVLTVGRLQRRKGHDQMILALSAVRRTIPDILYAIVGDGDERSYLDALVAREGLQEHVRFLGELDDEGLVHCYQQCDLFALPNRQVHRDIEGFGIVLLEAQACGKPVIAGTSGGTAETMDAPRTGRLVSCDGPHELAELVQELLSNRQSLEQMGNAARQWVLDRFDWEILGLQAKQVLQSTPPQRQAAGSVEPLHS